MNDQLKFADKPSEEAIMRYMSRNYEKVGNSDAVDRERFVELSQ